MDKKRQMVAFERRIKITRNGERALIFSVIIINTPVYAHFRLKIPINQNRPKVIN